jgi:hypothetical protein
VTLQSWTGWNINQFWRLGPIWAFANMSNGNGNHHGHKLHGHFKQAFYVVTVMYGFML